MRLARIILEGLLVTFLAALPIYLLRDQIVAGLLVGILVCVLGLGLIAWIERGKRTIVVSVTSGEWRQVAANAILVHKANLRTTNHFRDPRRLTSTLFRACEDDLIHNIPPQVEQEIVNIWGQPPVFLGTLGPGDTVSGWVLCKFRGRPLGGTPGYEIGVMDEQNNEYWARPVKERPRAVYGKTKWGPQ